MADEFEINEDTLTSDETNETVEESAQEQAALSDFYDSEAGKARDDTFKAAEEAKVEAVTDANIKLEKTLAEQNGLDISDDDAQKIKEFDKTLRDKVVPNNLADAETIKAGKAAEANLPPKYIEFKKAALKSTGDSFKTKLMKGVSSETSSKLSPELDTAEQLGQKVKTLLDDPTSTKADIQDALDEYQMQGKKIEDIIESDTEYRNKIEAKAGSEGWKITKAILYMLGILGAIGSLWAVLALFAQSLSGCYMYYNSNGVTDSYLLTGCKDYYNKIENQSECGCITNTTPLKSPSLTTDACTKLGASECTAPYCLGRCATYPSTRPPVCAGFPDGQYLQCTAGTIADEGYVSYGYKAYTPSSLLGTALNALGNILPDLENSLSKLFQGLGKILLIVLVVLVVLIILWILFRKFVLDKSSNSNSNSK